jgi:hypothetical protein
MYNPYLSNMFGNSRNQFTQQQQQQYDFSGWGDRLTSIEQGIKGLTEHFKNINIPGSEVGEAAPASEYAGNTAPEPLGGIESLVAEPAPAPDNGTFNPVNKPTSQPGRPSPFGGGQLGRHMIPYQPGQEGFTPLTAEQFASQQDLWGQRQDYNQFSDMAADVTGVGLSGRYKRGPNPMFGHAYETWQGADQSQGMENWMQNYNFDLAPGRPEWQPGQSIQNVMQDYTNSPEYQEWQQREEGRGPLSQSTIQAMGGMQHTGGPDIDPFISMGFGSPTATPTYEGYMDMVNQQAAGYKPQTPGAGEPFISSQPIQQQIGLAGYMANKAPALGGPTQKKIQQGIGINGLSSLLNQKGSTI